MTIHLNGEVRELDAPMPLPHLLEQLSIDPRRVAVEKNRVVVRRADYDATMIDDGDEVEIVNFVGGGSGKWGNGKWGNGKWGNGKWGNGGMGSEGVRE